MSFTSEILRSFPALRADTEEIAAGLASADSDRAWLSLQRLRKTLVSLEPLYKAKEKEEKKKRERIESSPRPVSTASRQLAELLAVEGYDTTLIALRLQKITGVKYPKRRILAWRIEREVVPLQLLQHIDLLWRLQFG